MIPDNSECLGDPIKALRIRLEQNGDKTTPSELEILIVETLKAQAIEGVLEHSQNGLVRLVRDRAGDTRLPRASITNAIQRLLILQIIRQRDGLGATLFSLRLFSEASRREWNA